MQLQKKSSKLGRVLTLRSKVLVFEIGRRDEFQDRIAEKIRILAIVKAPLKLIEVGV